MNAPEKRKNLRVINRVIVLDRETGRTLLVRNKDADYWYPPGGGWNFSAEKLREGAVREVEEETGIKVHIIRLMYAQEFDPENNDMHFEVFWLAYTAGGTEIRNNDQYGVVEEARWFTREEIQILKVFPKRLVNTFWDEVGLMLSVPDPFISK